MRFIWASGTSCLAYVAMAASAPACAQVGSASGVGVEEIIVTAQKREQRLQDVPIAVTAITGDMLQANRVSDVTNLTGLVPGLLVRTSAGGSQLPSFSMRGILSFGVVPGSDKQVSMYLDGVYISSPRGSIFDIPSIERIEALRGPQGTLFGRNATGGAISIVTRDPTGEMGVHASATVGNYDQFRFETAVNLPQVGPFSGYASYVHNYKRGDIRNAGAGRVWDRTASLDGRTNKVERSPDYLGTRDSDSLFAALKFESGDFTTVYKFDHYTDNGTPEGTGLVGYNPNIPLLGSVLTTLFNSQARPVNIASDGKRPEVVDNSFAIPITQRISGHSLTSKLQITDRLSVKNIFAYRSSFVFAAQPLDGVSALPLTQQTVVPLATFYAFSRLPASQAAAAIPSIAASLQPLVGAPFLGIATQQQSRNRQLSDELQLNYDSDFLTATAGLLWFDGKDWTQENLLQISPSFVAVPNGVFSNTSIGYTRNNQTSLAAYGQLEFHLTPQLDIVAGGRITRDKKTGVLTSGPNLASLSRLAFSYRKTKPSYLIGVNYKPSQDILLYAKYSTAFVSGGSTGGVPYLPETAASLEGGVKADLFDRKLRANLAVYTVTYKHSQGPQSATTGFQQLITDLTGDPGRYLTLGTFVLDQGTVKATGFEFETTVAPARGLQVGGSLSYTSKEVSDTPQILLNALSIVSPNKYELTQRPDWTVGLWGQYDTPPLAGGKAYLSFRADANWQSEVNLAVNPNYPAYLTFAAPIKSVPAYWSINGRVALKDLDIGGVKTQLAVWGKNLTNRRDIQFALNLNQIFAAANYVPARTYGVDLTIDF